MFRSGDKFLNAELHKETIIYIFKYVTGFFYKTSLDSKRILDWTIFIRLIREESPLKFKTMKISLLIIFI